MNEWSGIGHMGSMWIWWILGIVLVVAVLWMAVGSPPRKTGHDVSAEELLKRRYARGEISREDYEERLQDLRK